MNIHIPFELIFSRAIIKIVEHYDIRTLGYHAVYNAAYDDIRIRMNK